MALPELILPIYELTIPSSGKQIKVRPFVVKEEKILLMAAESDDDQEIINTTIQVIKSCIVEGDVNIEKLPFFDIDYLFIALRAKSIGETVDMSFICNNIVEDEGLCGHKFEAPIDISKATIIKDDTISSDIKLSGTVSLKLKYPTYSVMRMLKDDDNPIERKIKILINCIDYIADKDKVLSSKDYSKEELRTFVESMTEEQFSKMDSFITNFPSFSVNLEKECGKCGFTHLIEYKDFNSFF
jgi:hypothetical protein